MGSARDPAYRFNGWTLEPAQYRFRRGEERISLRPKTFRTLLYLIEHRSRVVSKDELLDAVWVDTAVDESVLSQCIGELRRALHDDVHRPRYIETIPRIGYRFKGKVAAIDSVQQSSTRRPVSSIAVLPFKDMSRQKDQDYLCEGVAEEIINALCHLKNVRVIARTSSFSFKDKNADIREIGERLNVNTILEGSVRKEGNRLRIAVQLINVADLDHLWSDEFDRKMGDLFSIQDEISLAVAEHLSTQPPGKGKVELPRHQAANVEAYNLNLKGRYLMYRESRRDMKDAAHYFEQAIEIDSGYAAAYARLSVCYVNLAFWNYLEPREAFRKSRHAVLKALEIDPVLAAAHQALAWIRMASDWDWEGAERSSRRALELNPSSSFAHVTRATYLAAVGSIDEAVVEGEHAIELEPYSNPANSWLGWCLLRAGRLTEAIDRLRKALEFEPVYQRARWFLGLAYVLSSRNDEGIAEIRKALDESENNVMILAGLGWAYGISGRTEEAQKILEDLQMKRETEPVPPYLFAKIHAGLGQKGSAFHWLDKAFDEHDLSLGWAKTDEALANLRDDFRFTALLRRLNLEP